MARCKVGDLCVILHSQITENIGRFVVVTRPVTGDPYGDGSIAWYVTPAGGGLMSAYKDGVFGFQVKEAGMRDQNLQPIRGKHVETKEKEKELVK